MKKCKKPGCQNPKVVYPNTYDSYCREHRNQYSASYIAKMRQSVIEFLGGKCSKCGFSDTRALHIDHIEGGGTNLNKKTHWAQRYNQILKGIFSIKVQLLCANCNSIKKYEEREMFRRKHV